MRPTCYSLADDPGQELLDRPERATHFTDLADVRDFLEVNLQRLTQRQQQTLLAWADGKTFKQIADEQGVAPQSVRIQFHTGMSKLRDAAWGEKSSG